MLTLGLRTPAPDRNAQLCRRLRVLAEERRRWGCPMLYRVILREGVKVNHKCVERLYDVRAHCAGAIGANG